MKRFLSLVAILGCFFLGMKAQDYVLVTSADDITADGEYVLAWTSAEGATYAMGSQNGTKYRNPVEITRADNVITITDEVYPFNLVDGTTDGSKAIRFITDGKYLVCTSTGNGSVKDSETLEATADVTLSMDEDYTWVITFVKNGNNGQCKLQYNNSAGQERFTNYKTGTQKNCNLYKKQEEAGDEDYIVLWKSEDAEGVEPADWNRVYTMSAEDAQNEIAVGDYLIVTISYVDPEGGWPQVAVMPVAGWPPYTNAGVSKEATCPLVVKFPVTGPLAKQMYENGFGISGADIRVSKVELEKTAVELDINTVWFGGKQCGWGDGLSLSKDIFANSLAGDKVVINYDPEGGSTLQIMPGGWSGPNFPSYAGLPFFTNDQEKNQMIFTLQPDFGAYNYKYTENEEPKEKTVDIFELLKTGGLTMQGPCYVESILYISDFERQAANMEAYEVATSEVQTLYNEWVAAEAEVEENPSLTGDEVEAGAISTAIQALFTKINEAYEAVAMEGTFENPVTAEEIAALKARINAWVEAAGGAEIGGNIVLWESEDAEGVEPADWKRVYTMSAEEAQQKIGVGDYLIVTISYVNPEGGWPQVAVMPIAGWPPYTNEGVSKEATCPIVVKFPITGPLANQMYENGFGISGGDIRISKVELEKATETLDPNTVWFGGKQCGWGNGISLSKDLFANSLAGDKVVINYASEGESTLQLLPGGWSGPNFPSYAGLPFFTRDSEKNQLIFTLQPDFGALEYDDKTWDVFELLKKEGLMMHGPCYVTSILYISDYARQAANMEAYELATSEVQTLYNEWAAAESEVEEYYTGFGDEEEAGAISAAIQALFTKINEANEAVAMEGNFENPVTAEEIAAIRARIEAWLDEAQKGFSGINAILNGESTDAEIYTITGIKVAAPVKGQINIVRINGKTYKMLVK